MNASRIRTLIVDDEPAARRGVRLLLEEDKEIEIIGEAGNREEALAAIRTLRPELLFLDIQMPGGTGTEMLASLPPEERPVVVFITAYDDYALKAFELHAVDYLLKPYEDERFREAVAHAKGTVRGRSPGTADPRLGELLELLRRGKVQNDPERDRILLRTSGEIYLLKADEVDWIEADGDYMKFHVAGKTHLMRETMARLEARLDSSRFVRIHRSIIVNLDRVRKLSPSFGGDYAVILRDGTSLKLSRGYHDRLAELLKQTL